MLVTFYEDINEDDGYSKLGLGIGLFSDDYGPADRHYVRVFQPREASDPVAQFRPSSPGNIIVWHTKPLC